MSKFARRARLVRDLIRIAVAVMRAIEVLIDLVNKVANCYAYQLRIQISGAQQIHLCAQ
jgi:hypothetical protein